METYALIKENGITRKINASDFEIIVNEYISKTVLSIIDSFIDKYGLDYEISVEEILKDDISNVICGRVITSYLRRIIVKENIDNECKVPLIYSKLAISKLKQISMENKLIVKINSKNFDCYLKEFNLIKMAQNEYNDSIIHKCRDCDNLSPLICEKAEYYKKDISKYDFIQSGYQIFDENDNLEKFIVLKCVDFRIDSAPYYERVREKRKVLKPNNKFYN